MDLFDKDMLGRTTAQSDACAADLTKQRARTRNFFDHGGLAKPHLAEALANLGLSLQLAHSGALPNRQIGQANACSGTFINGRWHKKTSS